MEVSTPTPRILIVDDDQAGRSLILSLLSQEGYDCRTAGGAEQAVEFAGSEAIQLVVSELKMPGRDGLWLVERLTDRFPDIPVIILSSFADTEAAVESLRRGATDYLLKPPKTTNLIRAIERALAKQRVEVARRRYQSKLERTVRDGTVALQRALRRIGATYQNTLLALVAALDAREHETSHHSQRVVRYTLAIAQRMGFGGNELEEIGRGALLHDIGKIGVRDSVLLKPGKLDQTEWAEMREHPSIGYRMIQNIPFLSTPADIVLSHQERWDGSGYPRHLSRREIPVGARIFAVADTLDAMTCDRPYRRGTSFSNAIAEIQRCAGTQFDPEAVAAFLSIREDGLIAIRSEMNSAREAPRANEGVFQELVQSSFTDAEDVFIRIARSQRRPRESQLQ